MRMELTSEANTWNKVVTTEIKFMKNQNIYIYIYLFTNIWNSRLILIWKREFGLGETHRKVLQTQNHTLDTFHHTIIETQNKFNR